MKNAFEIIRENQISIACVVAATLAIPTFAVTLHLFLASAGLDEDVKRAYFYKGIDSAGIGYSDAEFYPCDDCIRITKVQNVLDWTIKLGFVASALHFVSSAWSLFKKSRMSVSLWIVAQLLSLISLVGAIVLPILNKLTSAHLLLSLFDAVLVVDAMLTLVLLAVVSHQHLTSGLPSDVETGVKGNDLEAGNGPSEIATVEVVTPGDSMGANKAYKGSEDRQPVPEQAPEHNTSVEPPSAQSPAVASSSKK